jgi:hypothetical protein
MIHVAAVAPVIMFVDAKDNGKDDAERFLRSQTALVKSRFVLNKVFDRPEIKKFDMLREHIDPADWLELGLEFVGFDKSHQKCHKTNRERFAMHFGASPETQISLCMRATLLESWSHLSL